MRAWLLAWTVLSSGCLIERGSLLSPDAPSPDTNDAFVVLDTIPPVDSPPDVARDAPHIDAPACEGTTPMVCEGACVDLATDVTHCGACNVACNEVSRCVAGTCTCALSVYAGCEPGLRIWLDAQNTTGTGTAPEGALTTWANLAGTDAGNLELDSGNVLGVVGVEGNRAVRFGAGRMRTTGPLARPANTHMEIFLVARSRDLTDRGFTIGTAQSPPNRFSIHLPWLTTNGPVAYFDFPYDTDANGRMAVPFARSPRHIALWHAFQGNSGGEVRVNGTLVSRTPALTSASRDFTQRLWFGGVTAANQDVDLHELLVFDQPLSEDARTRIARALIARWHLAEGAPLPEEHLFAHLDAMQPLGTPDLPTTDGLPVWVDRGPLHHDAPTVGVEWQRDGLGTGFHSVRLRPGAAETNASHIDVPRPAEPFTAFLVMATEDGRGVRMPMQCPSVLATESETTDADGGLLLCGGRPAFFRGRGADPNGATLSPHRIDDGRRHLIIVRRASTGATTVTVDHEIVIDGNFGGGISAANWLIGRHEGTDRNGTLSADLGELLVYDAALDDDTVNQIERTLRLRWDTPIFSRPPFVSPCELGSQAVCPFQSIRALRGAPAGTHWLQLGTTAPFRVSVDDREGGGWVLLLQYVRQSSTPATTRVVQPGFDWPLFDDTRLGLGPQRASAHWGHIGIELARLLTDASELRWYGTTSAHARIIHFASAEGVDTYVAGRPNGFSGVAMTFTPLTGHSAMLPATATTFWGNNDVTLTEFPFFRNGQSHWGVGSSNRWEVDDFPGNGSNATVHRVWVR